MRPRSPDSPLQLRLFDFEGPARGEPQREETAPPAPEPRNAASAPPSVGLEARLRDRLNQQVDGRIRHLVLTRNRGQILAARPMPDDPRTLQVRLDACFVEAPEDALQAVARWLVGRPKERQVALRTIRAHFEQVRSAGGGHHPRPVRLRPRGAVHDLADVCSELLARYFEPPPAVGITWGTLPAATRRRVRRTTIRLGSFSYTTRTVKVHPALDHASVPRYVVEAVVFHELVHAALPPPPVTTARRCLHSPEFYAWERRFEHHELAQAWIQRNLNKLLARRSRR